MNFRIDEDVASTLRRARNGEMSNDVNKALRFFYGYHAEFIEMKRDLEYLPLLKCECGVKFSLLKLHKCPTCGSQNVMIWDKEAETIAKELEILEV